MAHVSGKRSFLPILQRGKTSTRASIRKPDKMQISLIPARFVINTDPAVQEIRHEVTADRGKFRRFFLPVKAKAAGSGKPRRQHSIFPAAFRPYGFRYRNIIQITVKLRCLPEGVYHPQCVRADESGSDGKKFHVDIQ